VQRASSQYIEDEQKTYEIDRLHPAHELWTAQDELLEAIEYLYTATQNLIRDRTRDLGSVIDESPQNTRDPKMREEQSRQALLKDQMSTLAAAICVNMEDKIRVQAT
jgi:nuclear pore complex protein Nup133